MVLIARKLNERRTQDIVDQGLCIINLFLSTFNYDISIADLYVRSTLSCHCFDLASTTSYKQVFLLLTFLRELNYSCWCSGLSNDRIDNFRCLSNLFVSAFKSDNIILDVDSATTFLLHLFYLTSTRTDKLTNFLLLVVF